MSDVETASHLTLDETARRMGAAIWMEERLFEAVGAWAGGGGPASARVVFAEVSRRHAWRAEQVRARLPEVPGFAADDVVAPPGPDAPDQLEGLTPGSLVAEVLPRLQGLYVDHIERCSAVSDASVARTLALVLADLRADAVALESVL